MMMMMSICADVCLPRTHEIQIHSSFWLRASFIFICCNHSPYIFYSSLCPKSLRSSLWILQFAFHDQFVFSGPLDEIQKIRGLASGWRKIIFFLIIYFIFLLLLLLCGERDNTQRTEIAQKKYKRIKC